MTVPTDAIQHIWNFGLSKITDPEDIAEFSIWTKTNSSDPVDQAAVDAFAQKDADNWSANIGDGDFCDNVRLSGCVVRTFNADGSTALEASKGPTTPWVGSADPPALPWETSLCVSLYTYQPGTFQSHGRRHRGRFYLPPMAASVLDNSNSGFVANSSIAARLAGYKVFVNLVGTKPDGDEYARPGVFSRVDSEVRIATWISLDAKIDSQRRRQNRETAGRSSLAL